MYKVLNYLEFGPKFYELLILYNSEAQLDFYEKLSVQCLPTRRIQFKLKS